MDRSDGQEGTAVAAKVRSWRLESRSAKFGRDQLGYSGITPLFLWRGAIALLALAAVLLLRQIPDDPGASSLTT